MPHPIILVERVCLIEQWTENSRHGRGSIPSLGIYFSFARKKKENKKKAYAARYARG